MGYICKEIGLVEEVDKIVGVNDKQIVTTGESLMAMVINGLGMIMVLSLLVYSVAQFKLRKALEEKEESIPDQLGKPTMKPTMRRVFQMFDGISLLIVLENEVEKMYLC